MPYPSSIATLAQARRRRGLGDATTGGIVGTAVGGPGVGTAIGTLVGGLFNIGGGANPALRPQHKALVNLLLAAGDQAGLQHIVTATFAGRSQKLYPTATLTYAQNALVQVASTAPASLATLQPLKAAYDASIAGDPGTGNVPWTASDGAGSGAHDWEVARAQLALSRASVMSGPLVPAPSVTDVLPNTTVNALTQIAQGLLPSGSIPNNPAYGPQPPLRPATASVGLGGLSPITLLIGVGLVVGLTMMKGRRG